MMKMIQAMQCAPDAMPFIHSQNFTECPKYGISNGLVIRVSGQVIEVIATFQ